MAYRPETALPINQLASGGGRLTRGSRRSGSGLRAHLTEAPGAAAHRRAGAGGLPLGRRRPPDADLRLRRAQVTFETDQMTSQPIDRRRFILSGTALALAAVGCNGGPATNNPDQRMFVGTYTRGDSRGIYSARLIADAGRIEVGVATSGIRNPSFLVMNRAGDRLYAVSEVGDFEGTDGGGVVGYAVGEDGVLTELGRAPTHGGAPCHLALDPSERFVVAANYSGGSASVLPIDQRGAPLRPSHVMAHHGRSAHPQRQRGPHAHQVVFAPESDLLFVVDLGLDRVIGYRLDAAEGRLLEVPGAGFSATAGAGPRHLAFQPDGGRLYLINELNSTLTALDFEAGTGVMREIATVSTVPGDFAGENSCADVHVHPSGRFVYGSNRGHDSIVVYRIDESDGAPIPVQHQPTGGETPRNFGILPGGRSLVVANQDSNSLTLFDVDPASGRLTPAGDPVAVPVPVCVRFT